MLERFKKPKYLILGILILALFLRIINFSFPFFTSDEARIAHRASILAKSGKDELGRNSPLIFNSLKDYQLPLTSYLTALGVLIIGKSNFGVKIPFTLASIGIVYLTYKISQLLDRNFFLPIFSALILTFSPVLIFLAKIPNDAIVLSFLITLLFYLLIKEKQNWILLSMVIILSFFVSKSSFFVVPPFVIFTLFFENKNLSKKIKVKISILCLALAAGGILFFLRIPQSQRSFLENNFPIFSDVTIQNGINRSRGQGLESGWPSFLEKILFNKSHILSIALLQWLSNLAPGIYFGQFDKSGINNFTQMGALAKILIIPFVLGLIHLIRNGKKQTRFILVYCFILTFPASFIYPYFSSNLVVLTLPFVAIVTSFGLINIKRPFLIFIIMLMVLEVTLNLLYIYPEVKNTNSLRPFWIKELAEDISSLEPMQKIALSDDIVSDDIVPFLGWFSSNQMLTSYSNVEYPYKFRQSNIRGIKIIGSENIFDACREKSSSKKYDKVFVSNRDKDKIKVLNIKTTRSFKDNFGKEIAFLLDRGLCIK